MPVPRFVTMEQWLAWQENLHPRAIDLGLERVQRVAQRLGLDQPPYRVITVGGTNGKGSSVAFLEAILRASGYQVGAYTSPHLLCYNERIRVNGVAVDNVTLCRAFAHIDSARGDVSLTYFEFGTLAALLIFQETGIQVAVLEVGLGGRLDAVNILDADAALVTSIAIDHVEWLGQDRDSIGREKAGIYRRGRPAICADPLPPAGLLEQARALGALLYQVGRDYGFGRTARHWTWWCDKWYLESLPLPALTGEHQLGNAAAALMTLTTLAECLPVPVEAIHLGLKQAQIDARFQVIPGAVEWILDVAHNPHAAAALAAGLKTRPCTGLTRAVVGMLGDKDAAGVARALDGLVDCWYTATLYGPRGRFAEQLMSTLREAGIKGAMLSFSTVADACRAAQREAVRGDRVVVFGSFYTVAQMLQAGLGESGLLQVTATGGLKFG